MKEPKYMKFDNNNSDKLEFFGKSLGPERKEEKRIINQSSQKKKKLPFSMPSDLDKKPVPNTQNEDFIPFFAKNFQSSSGSKDDICYINSPLPTNSHIMTEGEAEEVDVDEEEDPPSRFSKEKKILKIEDIADFTSEIEEDFEKTSKHLTPVEVRLRMKAQKEKNEEKKRKEEEEKRKKEEEERRKKEEEERRKKKRRGREKEKKRRGRKKEKKRRRRKEEN